MNSFPQTAATTFAISSVCFFCYGRGHHDSHLMFTNTFLYVLFIKYINIFTNYIYWPHLRPAIPEVALVLSAVWTYICLLNIQNLPTVLLTFYWQYIVVQWDASNPEIKNHVEDQGILNFLYISAVIFSAKYKILI